MPEKIRKTPGKETFELPGNNESKWQYPGVSPSDHVVLQELHLRFGNSTLTGQSLGCHAYKLNQNSNKLIKLNLQEVLSDGNKSNFAPLVFFLVQQQEENLKMGQLKQFIF